MDVKLVILGFLSVRFLSSFNKDELYFVFFRGLYFILLRRVLGISLF